MIAYITLVAALVTALVNGLGGTLVAFIALVRGPVPDTVRAAGTVTVSRRSSISCRIRGS
ncbi:MAG: hypothetical protein M3Z75_09875 [Actinomycetota bacterium]|nr:hypothetical protein [Actinomycetota bacterium]